MHRRVPADETSQIHPHFLTMILVLQILPDRYFLPRNSRKLWMPEHAETFSEHLEGIAVERCLPKDFLGMPPGIPFAKDWIWRSSAMANSPSRSDPSSPCVHAVEIEKRFHLLETSSVPWKKRIYQVLSKGWIVLFCLNKLADCLRH